jgi:hypothetical protein
MLKNYLKYLKHSGVWMGLVFNPYHWEFVNCTDGIGELAAKVCSRFISIGPIWIRVVIDDGSVN